MIIKNIKILCLILVSITIFSACLSKNSEKKNVSNISEVGSQSTQSNMKTDSDIVAISNPNNAAHVNKEVEGDYKLNETDSLKLDTAMRHYGLLESIAVERDKGIPLFLFSKGYVNILNGESKQGMDKNYFNEFFKNDKIYKADSITKIVDFKKREVLTYDEIMKFPEQYFVNNKAGFKYQRGDMLVIFPPAEGSLLKNGWIGVYRKEANMWKIVAGSF